MGADGWTKVTGRRRNYRTKEDEVAKISTSVYITNFPESITSKELYNACKQYGHVVDTYIPNKRSKAGKRFGFVKFINVFNVERLVNNLGTVWIARYRLQANITKFDRAPKNSAKYDVKIGGGIKHTSMNNSEYMAKGAGHSNGASRSYVQAAKGQKFSEPDMGISKPAIVLDDDCLNPKDLSCSLMGRVKKFSSLPNLKKILCNEGFAELKIRYLGELWVLLEFENMETKDQFNVNVGACSWFSALKQASIDVIPKGRIVWVDIEGTPYKFWSGTTFKKVAAKWGELLNVDEYDELNYHSKRLCILL